MSTDPNRALAIAVATYMLDSCSQLLKQIDAHNMAAPAQQIDPEPWHTLRGEARQLLAQVRGGELTEDEITARVQQFSAKAEQIGRLISNVSENRT